MYNTYNLNLYNLNTFVQFDKAFLTNSSFALYVRFFIF